MYLLTVIGVLVQLVNCVYLPLQGPEYSSSVQKTYQQDINVRKPSLIGERYQVVEDLPPEEENHHIYKEEIENINEGPISRSGSDSYGAGVYDAGPHAPHVALVRKENAEKTVRKSVISKPVISHGELTSTDNHYY